VVIATGSAQRLPVFVGNRLPGIMSSVAAYHLAKRYGVALGPTAVVSTQSNYAYRLALRLHDAGVGIRRIVDVRINPQSRFVDFAKASGLNLGSGQLPMAAIATRQGLAVAFANAGTAHTATTLEASSLLVSGGFQPELSLWMLAGGGVRWSADRLEAEGRLDRVVLAGAALGYRSLQACGQSGKVAVAQLFSEPVNLIDDVEIGASFETTDAPTPMAPPALGVAFLDSGESLVQRPASGALTPGQALTIGDVTASVALGMISPADAAAVAEERGAPGDPLTPSSWTPIPQPAAEIPAYLHGRFGSDPRRVHLIVDGKRQFEIGALVYSNAGPRNPSNAVGVIIAGAEPGGIALLDDSAANGNSRFVVETMSGASPARIKS
jgi:sarcosine oxidase subunit alpha